jgi:plastocyanin
MTTPSRREFLKVGGVVLVGLGLLSSRRAAGAALLGARLRSAAALEVIEMRSDALGARVWFDPIGLYVEPGAAVRWIVRENVHTTTAYHPRNDRHPLRIPERAVPWDSGYLVYPGDHFDITLTVPGVYDYYCTPHEAAGMVGRIVVGKQIGTGAEPFDSGVGRPGTEGWRHIPDAAREIFPSVARILAERRVHPAGPGK